MPRKERLTFLPYSKGIDPGRLRIGQMCVDPYNPSSGLGKQRFLFKKNDYPPLLKEESQAKYEEFIQEWTGKPTQYPKYTQAFVATSEWATGLGVLDMLSGQFSKSKEIQGAITGENAREFTVFEPEDFFDGVVLEQDGARAWLEKMLSTQGNALSRKSRPTGIWVCVGLVYIQNGDVTFGANLSKEAKAALNIDPGTVTTGIPSGKSAAQIEASAASQNGVQTSFEQISDQVWAAQWHQVKVNYGKAAPGTKERPMAFELMQIESDASNYRGIESDDISEKINYQVAEIIGLSPVENHMDITQDATISLVSIDERPYHDATKDVDWRLFNHDLDYLNSESGDVGRVTGAPNA